MQPTVLAESSILYFIFSPGSLSYSYVTLTGFPFTLHDKQDWGLMEASIYQESTLVNTLKMALEVTAESFSQFNYFPL